MTDPDAKRTFGTAGATVSVRALTGLPAACFEGGAYWRVGVNKFRGVRISAIGVAAVASGCIPFYSTQHMIALI